MDNQTSVAAQTKQARTACAVVGGGPAGAMLALLLARQGVDVTLLERHGDFDRDFRGDSLQIAVLELLDELGLLDRLLELPHKKNSSFSVRAGADERTIADFTSIRTRHPYVVTMPQVDFLNFIVAEASRYPNFHMVFNANVQELIIQNGVVHGVRYQGLDGSHELRALVTVGADGRHSKVRHLAGIKIIKLAAPLDLLWFRLPLLSEHEQQPSIYAKLGYHVNVIARHDSWQIGIAIPKGEFQTLRKAGIETLRARLAEIMPDFADRLATLTDWRQISLLSVESARVKRWYKPGLLLIGDAAHVLSPFVGAGINFAIQDAVAASNILGDRLRVGRVNVRDLAAVQRKRQWAVRLVQWFDSLTQHQMRGPQRKATSPHSQPGGAGHNAPSPHGQMAITRLPFFQKAMMRYVGYGLGRVKLKKGRVIAPGAPTILNAAPVGRSFAAQDNSAYTSQQDSVTQLAKPSLLLRLHNHIALRQR